MIAERMARIRLLLAVLSLTWIVLELTSVACSGTGYYGDSDSWYYPSSAYVQQYTWNNEINFFLNEYGEGSYPSVVPYSYSLPANYGNYGLPSYISAPIFSAAYYPSITNSYN